MGMDLMISSTVMACWYPIPTVKEQYGSCGKWFLVSTVPEGFGGINSTGSQSRWWIITGEMVIMPVIPVQWVRTGMVMVMTNCGSITPALKSKESTWFQAQLTSGMP